MDSLFLNAMLIVLLFAWMAKLSATHVQYHYQPTNPLDDPDYQQFLAKHGVIKTLQMNRLLWFAGKSVIPVVTILWVALCWFLVSVESPDSNILSFAFFVLGVLVTWQAISAVLNWKTARRFRKENQPLVLRINEALSEERARQEQS